MPAYFGKLRQTLAAAMPAPLNAAFGDSVTYTVIVGGPTSHTVTGLLVEPQESEAGFPGVNTGLKIHETQFPAVTPARGDEVTCMGSTYTVWDVDKSGIGYWMLALRKKA